MTEAPICPCENFTHPKIIFNPPGREAIDYRVGTYLTFRRALLQSLTKEIELTQWRPGVQHDLALQLVEWWAYLADILTFYNERIANESYLRTADLPESVHGLIKILGYRPRPGIGAQGVLAALTSHPTPFTLPQGFQIQSKPGPGKQPQIFELDVDTPVHFPDAIAAEPLPNFNLTLSSVLLKGAITTVKVGDEVLFLKRDWNGTDNQYALATVQFIQLKKEPRGNTNTLLSLIVQLSGIPENAQVQDYRLLKSNKFTRLYLYKANHTIASDHLHLEPIQRDIKVGGSLLLENPAQTPKHILVCVIKYLEMLWYANTSNINNPTRPPNLNTEPAVPILHTDPYINSSFLTNPLNEWDDNREPIVVYLKWQEVRQLIAKAEESFEGKSSTIKLTKPVQLPVNDSVPILIEDTRNKGILAKGKLDKSEFLSSLSPLSVSPFSLKSPLSVLFNLLAVSRGQTVTNEVLEGTLTKTPIGGWANLRNVYGSAKAHSAFDEFFYTADVRRGRGQVGWHNIPRLGVFLWRLKSFGLDYTTPVAVKDCPNHYSFDPTGRVFDPTDPLIGIFAKNGSSVASMLN